MFLKCLILLFFLNLINAQFSFQRSSSLCPKRTLLHGRIRMRQRGKLAEHLCFTRYTLVGNKYATCRKGEWDVPKPVCVRSGCSDLDEVKNAILITSNKGAWVNFYCLPGYKLEGSPSLYCDGINWNSSVPECVESIKFKPATSCDFEDEGICGWSQDVVHDFDWLRYNLRTPSTYFLTGPSHDHTYGKNGTGYYMYIEGTSQLPNDTARLLSPVYDAELARNGCFIFYYHMYGRDIGGLRVYQKPDSMELDTIRLETERDKYLLFEKWGEQGDHWFDSVSPLKDFSEDFQIVFEGIRGISYASDLAIDDVAILQGENCSISTREASTPPPITVDSCEGRCYADNHFGHNCRCDIVCIIYRNCCPDYMAVCEYGNSTDVPDWYNDTMEMPQTQKLVARETTTIATTTPTTKATTTTTQPTTTTTTKPTRTTKFTTTKLTTPKLTTTKLATTKLTTTSRLFTPTSDRKRTVPIATTKSNSTTTRNYTKTTPKSTIKTTPKFNTTTNSGRVNRTTTRRTKKPTFTTTRTTITRNGSVTRKPTQKKISSLKSSEGVSGAKVAAIVIVLLVMFCGLIWVGYVAKGSRSFAMMAHLRGRVRGESEVRYLNGDVDDDE